MILKRMKRGDFDFDWDDICTLGNFYQGNKKCTHVVNASVE